MPHFHFTDSIQSVPAPYDGSAVEIARADWLAATDGDARTACGLAVADLSRHILDDDAASAVLDAVFGNSPFLTMSAIRDPVFVCELLVHGPDDAFSRILSGLSEKGEQSLNDDDISRLLRRAKRQVALAVGFADIAGVWSLEKITGSLSIFAGAALDLAAAHLLRAAARLGAFDLANSDNPLEGSGLIIIGMGKLGACELNYSSDIDLIVLYDTDRIKTSSPDRLQNNFVRLTRNLVKLMDERTQDGYVFRTDLRLRPDPGATPLALSVLAAETYYESLGQNWERAAMIKARAVAGDKEAGRAFLKTLDPFIWRKSLDFAAIQDIHSIKRQINAHKGGNVIGTRGHNIKLGSGGIREIEFFAQTQQLIWGGREPSLRSPMTVKALADLAAFGQCDENTAAELTESYEFLRRVEHRLQMVNDEQSQTLPESPEAYERLAVFLGFASSDAFSEALLTHLNRVQEHYGQLFADAPSLGAEGSSGNLVFTGGDADPDTLKTIGAMGFRAPETVDGMIRAWHHGRHRATQSTRSREILTELMPSLLRALAATADPDAALLRFDEFLRGLPAGVQLFSMFQAHPHLLDMIAELIGIAPRLARHMSAHPSVLDSVLAGDFFGDLPNHSDMQAELSELIDRAEHFEEVLDTARRWAHDRRFQVGVRRLQGSVDPEDASLALSNIAESVLACLFQPVANEFAVKHGVISGAEMAIVALGKLGSREMTASSDLDLVFIYQVPTDSDFSDGDKKLPPTQYFARLGQRFINAITALTAEGSLYEVDMRLRPSGNAGPIATTVEAFRLYQKQSAWTWEHMALTRARVVHATSGDFRDIVTQEIRDALTRPRDADKLLRDVADMRQRLVREKPAECLWSLKQLRGGMVDIEFIVQYLVLKHAAESIDILAPNTLEALGLLSKAGVLDARVVERLFLALRRWHGLQGMLSLTVEDDLTAERAAELSDTLKARLAKVGDNDDFATLEASMQALAAEIHCIFVDIIEAPAKRLPPPDGNHEEMPAPPV